MELEEASENEVDEVKRPSAENKPGNTQIDEADETSSLDEEEKAETASLVSHTREGSSRSGRYSSFRRY